MTGGGNLGANRGQSKAIEQKGPGRGADRELGECETAGAAGSLA